MHPFIVAAQTQMKAKVFPSGIIDYSTDCGKDCAVVSCSSINNRPYGVVLDNGQKSRLQRATTFSRVWSGDFSGPSSAAAIGTNVHEAINAIVLEHDVIPQADSYEAQHCINLFVDWHMRQSWKVLATEAVVWSHFLGVAGRFDALYQDEQGRTVLVDCKTSDTLYDHYRVQQAVYAFCLSCLGIEVHRSLLLCLPKPEQGDRWTEHVVWDTPEGQMLYVGILNNLVQIKRALAAA